MTHGDSFGAAASIRAAAVAKAQLQRLLKASRRAAEANQDPAPRPLVTIAIPSYNHAAFVAECIRSVIDQDYDNIELIIIDDGSTDGSAAIIEAMAPQCRARFSRFEIRARENRGLANTLNEAVDWAKGTYFSLIASDDILFPQKTTVLVRELERETGRIAGVFAGGSLIDEQGRAIGFMSPPAQSYAFDDIILRRHSIMAPCQMLVLEKVKRAGPIPSGLYIEDWYLWLALTRRGDRLKVIEGKLVGYRQHGTNISKNAAKMFEGRKRVLDHFADSQFYDVAMAKCCLMAAMDHSSTSKTVSVHLLGTGLRHSRRILLTWSFARLLGHLLVPRSAPIRQRQIKDGQHDRNLLRSDSHRWLP